MNAYQHILTEQQAGIATITLNRPQAYNALSSSLLDELLAEFKRLAGDEHVRVVVLAAAGTAFCAGHDLKEMASMPREHAAYAALFKQCNQVMLAMQDMPQPMIAKVQGIATAAGCQLVAQCDLAVAADTAQFATSGIHYGLFCATPGVPLLRTVPLKHAMHLLLTGDFISAHTAAAQGLINQAVPAAQLDAAVHALAQRIAAQAPQAIALGKRMVYQQAHLSPAAAYQLAAHTMAHNMTLDCAQAGVAKFVSKKRA